MPAPAHEIAFLSYTRCTKSPDFLHRFYEHLLASDPAVPPMFASTELDRQAKLLKHALGLLLSYGRKSDDLLLARLAAKHSRKGIDVPPPMYSLFMDSLITTVREFDPECDAEVEDAWREALRPGIEFMQSKYDG